jgi:hypothetical protein
MMKALTQNITKIFLIFLVTAIFLFAGIGITYSQPKITAELKATPETYSGQCPTTIKFLGKITVTNISKPPLKVQYKFIRSDGAYAPVNTIIFDKDGSKMVKTTWTLGGSELPEYKGWQAIKVVYPQDVESNKANFKIQCQTSPKKDLLIKITNCPKTVKAGQELGASFKVTAMNQGDTAVKDVAVDLVLRSDTSCPTPANYANYSPDYSNGVLLKGGREHVSLNPEEKKNVQLNGTNTIPSNTPTGKYYLCAVIDAGNKVKEIKEDNNCACCPVNVVSHESKPEITGYKEKCGKKGSNITIIGKNFGSSEGKGVALGGHGIHVDLNIISWNNTTIIARIPDDPKITEGQWYYTGIEKADHSEWLSNISKNITICK